MVRAACTLESISSRITLDEAPIPQRYEAAWFDSHLRRMTESNHALT